jgi:hypothetical protein
LKVTIRLSAGISRLPVCGFLPLRLPLSFTQNFPNPLIRTFSPASRVCSMISKVASTALGRCCFGEVQALKDVAGDGLFRESHDGVSYPVYGWDPGGPAIWTNMHEFVWASQPTGVSYGNPMRNRWNVHASFGSIIKLSAILGERERPP